MAAKPSLRRQAEAVTSILRALDGPMSIVFVPVAILAVLLIVLRWATRGSPELR